MKTINIIGAGPVGCYLAYLLAGKYKVRVFEEHPRIGKPVQCTGIITPGIWKFAEDPGFVKNRIQKARIISSKKKVDITLKNENIIVDRRKFDKHFYEKAKQKGAKFLLRHKFLTKKKNFLVFRHKEKIRYYSMNKKDILVGADGTHSKVYKLINKPREFFIAPQVRLKLKTDNRIYFFIDDGHFGWIVPEGNGIARVGIVVKKALDFEHFMHKRIPNWKENIIEYQSGCIPKYDPKIKTQEKNIYLIGDAAGHVKATTAGGILQGLIGAKCLAEALTKGRNYEKLWKKRIGKDLWLHLKMHNTLNKFSKKDKNKLVEIFSRKKNKEILEQFDRDYPTKYILKIATEWRLWKFAKYIM